MQAPLWTNVSGHGSMMPVLPACSIPLRNPTMRTFSFLFLTAALLTNAGALSAQTPDAKGIEFFEAKIRPVLIEQCYKCHSEDARKNKKLKAKLTLDTKAGFLKGGESGPAFVPGKPNESLLMKALRHEGEIQMPQ